MVSANTYAWPIIDVTSPPFENKNTTNVIIKSQLKTFISGLSLTIALPNLVTDSLNIAHSNLVYAIADFQESVDDSLNTFETFFD